MRGSRIASCNFFKNVFEAFMWKVMGVSGVGYLVLLHITFRFPLVQQQIEEFKNTCEIEMLLLPDEIEN